MPTSLPQSILPIPRKNHLNPNPNPILQHHTNQPRRQPNHTLATIHVYQPISHALRRDPDPQRPRPPSLLSHHLRAHYEGGQAQGTRWQMPPHPHRSPCIIKPSVNQRAKRRCIHCPPGPVASVSPELGAISA